MTTSNAENNVNSLPPSSGREQLLNVFKNSIQATASGRMQISAGRATLTPDARVSFSSAASDVTQDETNLPNIPANIVAWLAKLNLLYGVPFEYIVPDAAMLPPEGIRFFYLDQNWSKRLIDGAVNIAIGSSQDAVNILTYFEDTVQQAALAQHNVRATLRNKPLADSIEVDGTVTGLLLRSAVVSGWPGMEVQAFADEAGTQPLPILRMDRLSDNVLLCLFNGAPKLVCMSEPPEGLHFGVIGGASTASGYQVALRSVGVGEFPAGEQINTATSPIFFRNNPAAPGVIDVTQSKNEMIKNLAALNALPRNDKGEPIFTSSQFAVQMVKGAGLQQFKNGLRPAAQADNQSNVVKP